MQIQTKYVDGKAVEWAVAQAQRIISVDDTDWPVPPWATHYSKGYYGDRPRFWCKVENGFDIVSRQQFYCWAYYDKGEWLKDPTACSRHFINLPD